MQPGEMDQASAVVDVVVAVVAVVDAVAAAVDGSFVVGADAAVRLMYVC